MALLSIGSAEHKSIIEEKTVQFTRSNKREKLAVDDTSLQRYRTDFWVLQTNIVIHIKLK